MVDTRGKINYNNFILYAAVAQLDRALVYETKGQEFESLQPRQRVLRRTYYGKT